MSKRIDLRIKDEDRSNELKRSTILCHKINMSMPYSEEQKELIKELFVNGIGEGTSITPPLYINRAYNIYIGNNCSIQNNFKCMSSGNIIIHDNVQIAMGVSIITNNHDYYDRRVLLIDDVEIMDNAWIGANAIILPGITIGKNAVVGAGSVVTHDVGENEVVAGNPARVIKVLDNSEKIDDDFVTLYDLDNVIIKKDIDKNIWLESKMDSTSLIIAERYNEVVVPEGDDLIFILGDYISVINANLKLSSKDYKPYLYQSSYYSFYSGVNKFKDNIYTVNTDDSDIIVVKINNNQITFKRLFDYEINDKNIGGEND